MRFRGAFANTLAANLDQPQGTPRAYALMAHCFTCGKDSKALRRIGAGLAGHGIAVLRFDFSGVGESQGNFADTNFSSNLDDLIAAAEFLRNEYQAPRLLLGHSLGGAAALAVASRIDEVQAVATIAAPAGTQHLREVLAGKAPEVLNAGDAQVDLAGRTVRIKKQLMDDLDEHRLSDAIRNLNKALLIFHSSADSVVGIEEGHKIYESARHPKSFISLDRADHLLLSNEQDSRFIADILAAWTRRYLEG